MLLSSCLQNIMFGCSTSASSKNWLWKCIIVHLFFTISLFYFILHAVTAKHQFKPCQHREYSQSRMIVPCYLILIDPLPQPRTLIQLQSAYHIFSNTKEKIITRIQSFKSLYHSGNIYILPAGYIYISYASSEYSRRNSNFGWIYFRIYRTEYIG